jgi:hypothetical protein
VSVAHDLRSSLGAMSTWARVLEDRLRGFPDPIVHRALEGLRAGVSQQVEIIENLLEADAVQPPLRSHPMSKRKDAQPDIAEDSAHAECPKRPEPSVMKPEAPGGPREAKAEEDAKNKVTRKGER